MTFFKTVLRAFYSAKLYRAVRREGHFGLGYSFKLVAFCSALMVVWLFATAHVALFAEREGHPPLFDSVIDQLVPQIPAMHWKSGQLATDKPGVYRIVLTLNGENGPEHKTVATIDTSEERSDAQEGLTITRRQMTQRDAKHTRSMALTELPLPETLSLTHTDYQRMASQMVGTIHYYLWAIYLALGLFVFLAFTLILYVGRVALLLVISGILMVIQSSLLNEPMKLGRIMALAAVAYTPVALADTFAMMVFYHGIPFLILLPAGLVLGWVALQVSEPDTTLAA